MTIKSYKQNKMILRNNDDIEKKIRENLDNPILKYLITYKTDNWLFSLLETDFDLPEEIKINRKSYNHHILRQSEDISQIQDSLCDLIFSNNSTNVKYDIKSILDRCNYVPNYLSDKDKEVLELIYKFLNYNNDENENLNAEINNICKTIKDYDDKMKES
jgi:F0F1-type ATP synthase alpha subunit